MLEGRHGEAGRREVMFIECLHSNNCSGRRFCIYCFINMVYQNFGEYTKSNDHHRMQTVFPS